MKLKIREPLPPQQPAQAQLMLRHPNTTGLQMDQVTRLYSPAHFVKLVKVTFNGEAVFSAETDITI
ncbi:MAG: quinoprotein dehydrogenase-associated SoxYZ-like carrier, partial [Burkholderiales bacterium]|nr:quinoprotein dehydrogenase-associated SoxYZ-like carrier [Burkholderiales bacterium]